MKKFNIISVIFLIFILFLSCSKSESSKYFNVVKDYDAAVSNGDIEGIQKHLSRNTKKAIKQVYENETDFYEELVREGEIHKNDPSFKLKSTEKIDEENVKVIVTIENGGKKTFYLKFEDDSWKIDITPQLKKLSEVENQFIQK
ncbi:MAG: hypothetical protein PHV06_02845 [bacterium]|nr:hypothetical protein [bacterium]